MRAAAGGPMRVLHAEQMIDDAAATLHVGLTALARAIGEGHDIAAASMMLWREYERARQALVGLAAAET